MGALRSMMMTFRHASGQPELDGAGEAKLAAGYAATLDEAIDLLDLILDVELSTEVARLGEKDVLVRSTLYELQRQLPLALVARTGEVVVGLDELEAVGGGLAVTLTDDGKLAVKRGLKPETL